MKEKEKQLRRIDLRISESLYQDYLEVLKKLHLGMSKDLRTLIEMRIHSFKVLHGINLFDRKKVRKDE